MSLQRSGTNRLLGLDLPLFPSVDGEITPLSDSDKTGTRIDTLVFRLSETALKLGHVLFECPITANSALIQHGASNDSSSRVDSDMLGLYYRINYPPGCSSRSPEFQFTLERKPTMRADGSTLVKGEWFLMMGPQDMGKRASISRARFAKHPSVVMPLSDEAAAIRDRTERGYTESGKSLLVFYYNGDVKAYNVDVSANVSTETTELTERTDSTGGDA